jgi:hypothetical protein
MSYHFAVTGIGLCVGSIADHEDLIEAITTGKKPPKPKVAPTAHYAIQAALKYQDEKPVILIANTQVSQTILTEFRICQQRSIEHFARMIRKPAGSLRRTPAKASCFWGRVGKDTRLCCYPDSPNGALPKCV